MKPTFPLTRTDELKTVQQDVANTIAQFDETTRGTILWGVAIATTATRIAHGLGNVPSGWSDFSRSANATIWQSSAPTREFLYLQASAPVTCNLKVF